MEKGGLMENNEKSCKEIFAERLKLLRSEKGLSQEALAKDLGISKGSLGFYETCKNIPSIEVLNDVSKYFKVSLDYLLGRSDARTTEIDIKAMCDHTGLSEQTVEFLHNIKVKSKNPNSTYTAERVFESINALFCSDGNKEFVANLTMYICSDFESLFKTDKIPAPPNPDNQSGLKVPMSYIENVVLLEIQDYIKSLRLDKNKLDKHFFFYFYNENQEGADGDGNNNTEEE